MNNNFFALVMSMFCYYISHEFCGGDPWGQQKCQLHRLPHHCLIVMSNEVSNEGIIALGFAFSFCYKEK
jgi:hypothetical protein